MNWNEWFRNASQHSPDVTRVVIAEGGINHNGDVGAACEIVEMASRSGAHAVKFQKRDPDVCVPEWLKQKFRETPWGEMTYLEYKKRIELSVEDFAAIDSCARDCKIDWFVSAWDVSSQLLMRRFRSPVNKVASAMLTNLELLETIASEGKPTFISTGMSTLEDIDRAVEIFKRSACPFILMHSVSTYPALDSDLNLLMIKTLAERYDCAVGYSGHETSVSPSVVAAALGAVAIERHITLDRSAWGTDQAASLEEAGLTSLATILRRLPLMLGNGTKSVLEGELAVARNLRYWN